MSVTEGAGAAIAHIDQLLREGRYDEVADSCRALLPKYPRSADLWVRAGLVHFFKNEVPEAEERLRRALVCDPLSAARLRDRGLETRNEEGGAVWEQATEGGGNLSTQMASVWARIGNAFYEEQNWIAAAAAYREAVAMNPFQAAVWNNLGSAELKRGQPSPAQHAFERALALAPNHEATAANYAYLLCCLGDRNQAFEWLRQRIVKNPESADQWARLGVLFESMCEWTLAAAACCQALKLLPLHSAARSLLGRIVRSQASISAAADLVRPIVTSEPLPAETWSHYASIFGGLLFRQGRADEGARYLKRAVELAPNPERHSDYLLGLHYLDNVSPHELLTAHRQWNAAYAAPLVPPTTAHVTRRARTVPLRLGLVSGQFGRNPTSFLVLPGIAALDRSEFTIVWYSDAPQEDEYTSRLRVASDHWRNTAGFSDEQFASRIQADEIDILIDLLGHSEKRLLVFARRPAPLQMSWLGYAGTTGMDAIDCLLADRFHVRDGEEGWYSETIVRLPNDYVCYAPPADAPGVAELPALANHCVTLGCFNNPAKYSDRMMAAWAEILRRLPSARLLLKYTGLDDPRIQADVRSRLTVHGAKGDQLLFEGRSGHRELLASYTRIDLALDTFPYSGCLTTCEALWMGVPVVTFPGNTLASRHSTSHMTNAGYPQFVAKDITGYIDRAVEWTNRLTELAVIRSQMRDQVRQSPLCDAPRFAEDLQALLTQTWQASVAHGAKG